MYLKYTRIAERLLDRVNIPQLNSARHYDSYSNNKLKFLCLFVCHNPLVPSVLHGRGPRLRRFSSWALGMCAPTLPPILPRAVAG